MEPLNKKSLQKTKRPKKTTERTKCDVYSRVVGFITPTKYWNKGKREEYKDRVEYKPS